MAEKMYAVRLHDYGGPRQLEFEEVPRPEPDRGEVLVHIVAAGVNPADWKIGEGRSRQYMPLQFPWTPGLEAAGVIEKAGEDVKDFAQGEEVYGAVTASYAEYAVAKPVDLQPKPTNISFEQAAAVPVGALTAWGALIDTAKVMAGQRVLVHGAAGGVGSQAVQLAVWQGAHVTGTSSAANVDFVRSLGAEAAIDYNAMPFESQARDMDVVIDTVGGLETRSFKVMRPGGIYVTVAGRLPEGTGKAEGVRATSAGRTPVETLGKISRLIEAGAIRPVLGKTFALRQANLAQELSQTRHGRGRILLIMVA